MLTPLQKLLKGSLYDVGNAAVQWLEGNYKRFAAPEDKRPTPYEIFGQGGKNSANYLRAKRHLEEELENLKKTQSHAINAETSLGRADMPGYDAVKQGLDYLAKASGLTAEGLLAQFLKQKHDDHKRAENIDNPFSWKKFNGLSKTMLGAIPPIDIKKLFREIVNSKITTEKRTYETGSLDPDKFSRYYTGDVFYQEEQSRPKMAVYVFADNSSSMTQGIGMDSMPPTGEPSRGDICNEILKALFEVLQEVSDRGVRWAFARWGEAIMLNPTSSMSEDVRFEKLVVQKKIDQQIPKAQIPGLFGSYRDDHTLIEPVVDYWKTIHPEANEKIVIIVLTDGDFGSWETRRGRKVIKVSDPYDYIKKHPTGFYHIWIPISYDSNLHEGAKALFGGTSTRTKMDIYQAITTQFKRVLNQIY